MNAENLRVYQTTGIKLEIDPVREVRVEYFVYTLGPNETLRQLWKRAESDGFDLNSHTIIHDLRNPTHQWRLMQLREEANEKGYDFEEGKFNVVYSRWNFVDELTQ